MSARRNWWFVFIVVAGSILAKLWMTEAHEFLARVKPHDDSLFLNLAASITQGQWLGDFNNRTLIKGPGYPLFIALANRLGIPLLMAQQMFYALACVAAFLAVLPLCRSWLAAGLLFLLLLFNPASFNDPVTSSAFRESFYLSLGLLLTAGLLGLGAGDGRLTWRNLCWSLLLGMAAAWLWITREESIWVLPGVLFAVAWFLPPWPWRRRSRLPSRLVLVLIPILMVQTAVTLVRAKNASHYNVPHVVDIKAPGFEAALGGLMNIRHDSFARTQVVSADALGRALGVSPSLAELTPGFAANRYPASFFIWTLRSAARQAGYYDTPRDGGPSLDLYRRIGKEIAVACESGSLDCLDREPTLRPPWLPQHWPYLAESLWEVTSGAVGFGGFNVDMGRYPSGADDDYIAFAADLTGEHPERRRNRYQKSLSEEYVDSRETREYLMKRFVNVYQYLVPLLVLIALPVHGIRLVRSLRSRRYDSAAVAALLPLGSVLTLIAMLTYVLVTLWPIDRPLHTLYPLVLLYAAMVLAAVRPPAQPSRDS